MSTLRKSLPVYALGLFVVLALYQAGVAAEPVKLSPIQEEMVQYLDSLEPELVAVNQDIWTYAELGLQEYRSAARVVSVLKKGGFRVRGGVSDMPTAFGAEYGSGKAVISAKFTFTGLPAHASVSPERGRSALKAVELMNIGVNYMREHVKETSRIHYVITNGGAQPNVVPATAQVWYYCRGNTHEDAEYLFDWIKDIAESAAKMTRTRMALHVDTDCHEIIPNLPLSKLIARNFQRVGPPKFSAAEIAFARQLQTPLRADFGAREENALNEKIEEIPAKPAVNAGSTDVGDIS